MQRLRLWNGRLHYPIMEACCILSALYFTAPAVRAASQCLILPAFAPGIGSLYFCAPEEGERHLITLARRAPSKAGLHEDIWVNFRGAFADRVWINIGLQEHGDAVLLAWDALSLLTAWMHAIKAGDTNVLEAFLAPLEINPTYPYSDTYTNMLSNTQVYGRVKNPFPLSRATAHPRCYRRTYGQRTKVTL